MATTATYVLIHPLLGAHGLGSIAPWLPGGADVVPASRTPTVDGARLADEARKWLNDQGRRWEVAVGAPDGAGVAVAAVRDGLAQRAILLNPPPPSFPGTQSSDVAEIRAGLTLPVVEPPPTTDLADPRWADVLAGNDGSDPIRVEYAKRIRAALDRRLPLGDEPPSGEIWWAEWYDAWLAAPDRIVAVFSREYHVIGRVVQRHAGAAATAHLADWDELLWLSDPQALAREIASLAS